MRQRKYKQGWSQVSCAAGQGSGQAQPWVVPDSSLAPVPCPFLIPQNIPSAPILNLFKAQGRGIRAAGQGGDSPRAGALQALWRSRRMSRRIHGQRNLSDWTGTGQESRVWAQGSASVEAGGMGTMAAVSVLAPGHSPGHLSSGGMRSQLEVPPLLILMSLTHTGRGDSPGQVCVPTLECLVGTHKTSTGKTQQGSEDSPALMGMDPAVPWGNHPVPRTP